MAAQLEPGFVKAILGWHAYLRSGGTFGGIMRFIMLW